MANLLMLPDEIKIKIFDYLNGVDKIELLRVCQDFHRIGVDREILWCLDFSHSYKLTLKSHLKFIARKVTCHLVTELNINGIYWIPSAETRNSLMKFENLEALHVLDTQLTFRDLVTVLNKTLKVRKLALSLKPDNCSDVFVLRINLPISHLFVTFYSLQIKNLFNLLTHFSELEELWMIEPSYPHDPIRYEWAGWPSTLEESAKVTKKLVIYQQVLGSISLDSLKSYFLKDPEANTWNEVISICSDVNFVVLENKSTENTNIKREITSKKFELTLTEKNLSISDINQIREYEYLEDVKFTSLNFDAKEYFNMTADKKKFLEMFLTELPCTNKIRKWCSVSNCFWEEKSSETNDTSLFKKRRVGINFPKLDEKNIFARFTKHTSEMEEFEIIDSFDRNQFWPTDTLQYVKNWKILKKFTLTSVNLNNGKFLIDVTKNCTMLNCLKIQDELVQDNVSADLCHALEFAVNLKDFRYERKGGIPIDRLFESLKHCTKLERIYIQCRFASIISKTPLETVITRCENLVFLLLYITELPETVCKSIKLSINELVGLKPQQIIIVRGQTYTLKNIMYEDIPIYHVQDIVCQTNNFYSDLMKYYF